MRIIFMPAYINIFVLLLTLAVVSGCGGGGGGSPFPVAGGSDVPVAQGSADSPATITVDTPYAGQVDTSFSFHSVPVTAGQAYTITVSNMTDNVDLVVFTNNDWSTSQACSSMRTGIVDDMCNATASGPALYVLIMGDLTTAGAFYTITVSPTPPASPTGVIALAGNGQAIISWSPVSGAGSYNLYFSEVSGAGTEGTKITGTSSPYVHTGRTNGVTYYYVVTADNAGMESAPSSQVPATPSLPLSPPQTFNFDDGTLQGWSATGTWGLTEALTYSGSPGSVTDSPAGNYSNARDTSITSPVFDLSGASSPTLIFYHRYSIEDTYDKASVELSTDGGLTFADITPGVSYYSGLLPAFTRVTIDLSPYSTSSVVLRFRLVTDASATYDGWYLDAIALQ